MEKISEIMLSAYLDGELPADEVRLVEEALKQDPDLRQKLQDWRDTALAVREELKSCEQEVASGEIWQRLEPQLNEAPAAEHEPFWRRWRLPQPALRLALVAALLFASIALPLQLIWFSHRSNACFVRSLSSDRATVMVFRTKKDHVTVIWAFEDKKTGTDRQREDQA